MVYCNKELIMNQVIASLVKKYESLAVEYNILKLPKEMLSSPSTKSLNQLKELFTKHKVIVNAQIKPIMKISEIGPYVKATRKRKTATISDVDSIWGVYVGPYAIIYIRYEHIPGGITPVKTAFLKKRSGELLAEAASLIKLVPQIHSYLLALKRKSAHASFTSLDKALENKDDAPVGDEAEAKMDEKEKVMRWGPVVNRFKSKSNPKNPPYEVRKKDGKYTCNCKGFIFNKHCDHVKQTQEGKKGI